MRERTSEIIRAGRHGYEVAPRQSGRWGVSVVFRPAGSVGERLDSLAREAAAAAGGSHWLSGSAGRAHITVRALEPFSSDPPPPDQVTRYVEALVDAAGGPVEFEITAPVISPTSVMIKCRPTTAAADELRTRFAHALDDDGRFEDSVLPHGRDPIWYCSLVHFADRVRSPERLIQWVLAKQTMKLAHSVFDTAHLCRWDHDGTAMAPIILAEVPLDGSDERTTAAI